MPRHIAVCLVVFGWLQLVAGCKIAPGGVGPLGGRTEADADVHDKIVENEFCEVRSAPLSTFGLDVDTASYGNVRALLRGGLLPPADAVRVEEFVNAFRYHDPEPSGGDAVGAAAEVQVCPWASDHWLLRIGIRAQALPADGRAPANLVFLVDVSGSMDEPDKLPLVKRALGVLLDNLRPEDRLAIVTYASGVEVPLRASNGSDTAAARRVVDGLAARGSTNGAGGLRTAYQVARELRGKHEASRVILVTDGDFNVGVQTPAELRELVRREQGERSFLTVLGCGRGNLKDANLEAMADRGNGAYHYLDGMPTARRLFGSRFEEQMTCVAKDAKVQVEFNPERIARWRLIGYENRVLGARDFADPSKDGGDLGAGQTVTALYELVPLGGTVHDGVPLRYGSDKPASAGQHADELLRISMRWQPPLGGDGVLRERLVMAQQVAAAKPSRDFELASLAAGFGMLLRDSPHCGRLDWSALQLMTDRLDNDDVYEHELAELIDCAVRLRRAAGRS